MRLVSAVLILSALPGAARAAVDVHLKAGRVDVKATAAPVSEILERLSRQTGMKVVYEGLPPRQVITTTLQDRTVPEAILGILEGLGLNYALVMDPAGTKVETLLMAGAGGPGSAPPPAASFPQQGFSPANARPPEPAVEVEPEPSAEEEVVEGDAGAEGEEAAQPPQIPQGMPPGRMPGMPGQVQEQVPPEKQQQPPGAFIPNLPPSIMGPVIATPSPAPPPQQKQPQEQPE
jgi:hypothetical protein